MAGTLGSALVAAGGWGSGALPPGRSGFALGAPLALAGVLLLSFAWWRLRTGVRQSALLWAAPLLLAPPMFSRDAYAYVGQAALVVRGLDPYAVGPGALTGPLVEGVDDVWVDAPSPYGPLWLWLASLVVRVDRLLPALLGMRLLAVLGLLLAGWALHRLGGDRALWLGVANPLVLLHLVAGAHNEALMLGLMLAGLAVGSVPLAAVLITLGALVKLPALAALPFVVVVARGRLRAATQAAVASAATAALVAYGTGLGWGWLTTLDAGRARLSLLSVTTGMGVLLPGGDRTLDVVLLLGLLAGAALAALALWRAALPAAGGPPATPGDRSAGAVHGTGAALLAVALLLPVVQPWYVLWGVLPLAAVARPRLAAALGAGCIVLALLVLPSGRHVVRPPLYGVPMLLAVAAATATYRGWRVAETAAPTALRTPPGRDTP
jgi:alpha-1,6-mannosyltransferase